MKNLCFAIFITYVPFALSNKTVYCDGKLKLLLKIYILDSTKIVKLNKIFLPLLGGKRKAKLTKENNILYKKL